MGYPRIKGARKLTFIPSSTRVRSRCCVFERISIRVSGVVQGVGFRPFVYRLANEENLSGLIGNDTDGVTIELEGTAAHIAGLS